MAGGVDEEFAKVINSYRKVEAGKADLGLVLFVSAQSFMFSNQ